MIHHQMQHQIRHQMQHQIRVSADVNIAKARTFTAIPDSDTAAKGAECQHGERKQAGRFTGFELVLNHL
jgi:hypothetical protein